MILKLTNLGWVFTFVVMALCHTSPLSAQESEAPSKKDFITSSSSKHDILADLLRQVNEKKEQYAQTDAARQLLDGKIAQSRGLIAPHYPVKVQRPGLTEAQLMEEYHYNMNFWIDNYPDEVTNYVRFVNEVVNAYAGLSTEKSKQ